MRSIFLFFALMGCCSYSQSKIIVLDHDTRQPISYVNIWKDNVLYQTSDSIGSFIIKKEDIEQIFKISCIGYHDTLVKLNQTLLLKSKALLLDEVVVEKRKYKKKLKMGKARKGDTSYGVQWDSKTAMVAKFFSNDKKALCFLSTIRFTVSASTKNRKLALLFYTVDAEGKPSMLINTENIIITPKKGIHIAEIDINKFNIEFPKEGIFIVIQHPLLEQNKLYAKESSNPNAYFYEPTIAVDYTDGYQDTWYFKEDKWNKNERYSVNIEMQITD